MQPSKDSRLLVLCNNGIHHLRVRRFLVEALEESTLYGRLPDLWSEVMGRIVGKLLRGIAIQPGQRDGHGGGPDAVDPSHYRSIESPWPRFSPRHRPADRAMILRRPQRRVRPLAQSSGAAGRSRREDSADVRPDPYDESLRLDARQPDEAQSPRVKPGAFKLSLQAFSFPIASASCRFPSGSRGLSSRQLHTVTGRVFFRPIFSAFTWSDISSTVSR